MYIQNTKQVEGNSLLTGGALHILNASHEKSVIALPVLQSMMRYDLAGCTLLKLCSVDFLDINPAQ